MKWSQWVGIVAGIWLMAAPAVLEYTGTAADDVHRTVGPLIATFATIALWAATRDVRMVNLALAAVLVLAPLVSSHPAAATVVALATAAVVVATTPFGGPDPERRGQGWAGVLRGGDRTG